METIEIARQLRENELMVSRLYNECAKLFPEFAADFLNLAKEEEFHASIFDKLIAQIGISPDQWQVSAITLQTLQVLNRHLHQIYDEIISGSVAPRYALTALQSFELSMTERRVSSMLICQDKSCVEGIQQIDKGFDQHIKKLQMLETKIFGTGSHVEHFKF